MAGTFAFVNLPSDRHVVNADPAAPTVVLSGSASQLAGVSPSNVPVTIDLSGATAGTHQFAISPSQVGLPTGVTLQQLITSQVTLTIQ